MEHGKVEGEGNKAVDSASDKVLELKSEQSTALSSLSDFQYFEQLAAQMENLSKIASVFIKGGLCPIKTEPDFIVATISGQQLGLPMMTAVNNIIVVSNKPALTTHLMRALCIRAGVVFNKVTDFEPVFIYYEAEPDPDNEGRLRAVKIKTGDNPQPQPIVRGKGTIAEMDKTLFVPGRKEVDRITKYEFERLVKVADGTFKTIKVTSSFSMSDANAAGLLDKGTYQAYPARMLDARAFAIGAREIASDILFGMYTVAELADANDINYTMNTSFEESFEDAEIVQ